MKVIVRCAKNRITKTEMEREIESLFQKNKDLRVYISHLCDELSLAQQQSEARRQVICERDKLIQELNDQITAQEEEYEVASKALDKYSSRLAEVCVQRDNFEASYKQVIQWWGNEQTKAREAEARAEEYRIALMESDCRVDECEKRMDWLSKEVLDWKATAEGYKNQYEELKAQKEADDKKSEEICTACNERYEEILSERNRLRNALEVEKELRSRAEHEREEFREKAGKYLEERNAAWDANKRLNNNEETITYYQDIADHRKEKLDEAMRTITSLNNDIHELEETIDGLNENKRAYGEEIDRLRKMVIELQSNRFTTDEFIGMIMKNFMPSTDK